MNGIIEETIRKQVHGVGEDVKRTLQNLDVISGNLEGWLANGC